MRDREGGEGGKDVREREGRGRGEGDEGGREGGEEGKGTKKLTPIMLCNSKLERHLQKV